MREAICDPVRPHDEEVGIEAVTHVDGRAVLAERFLTADERLARDVAAALRERLVLEVQRGDAGALELADGAARVEGVAIAGVGIGDDRHARVLDDVRHAVDDLADR